MNANAILIGGIVPAVFLGLGTVLMRASVGAGATIPVYLAAVGTTVGLIGWTATLLTPGEGASAAAIGFAVAMGATWAIAIACIAYGFGPLRLPVAVVAPLTNSNALVAALIGAILFSEWKGLNMPWIAAGSVLICAGATVISFAK